jgi:hypothetical protein
MKGSIGSSGLANLSGDVSLDVTVLRKGNTKVNILRDNAQRLFTWNLKVTEVFQKSGTSQLCSIGSSVVDNCFGLTLAEIQAQRKAVEHLMHDQHDLRQGRIQRAASMQETGMAMSSTHASTGMTNSRKA